MEFLALGIYKNGDVSQKEVDIENIGTCKNDVFEHLCEPEDFPTLVTVFIIASLTNAAPKMLAQWDASEYSGTLLTEEELDEDEEELNFYHRDLEESEQRELDEEELEIP